MNENPNTPPDALTDDALNHVTERWKDIRAAAGDAELEQAYLDIAILVTALRYARALAAKTDEVVTWATEGVEVIVADRDALRAENERLKAELTKLKAWAEVAKGWLPKWEDHDSAYDDAAPDDEGGQP